MRNLKRLSLLVSLTGAALLSFKFDPFMCFVLSLLAWCFGLAGARILLKVRQGVPLKTLFSSHSAIILDPMQDPQNLLSPLNPLVQATSLVPKTHEVKTIHVVPPGQYPDGETLPGGFVISSAPPPFKIPSENFPSS